MSDWKKITPADVELLPVGYRKVVPPEWLDGNNHMNVMWYTHLFSYGLGEVFRRVGLTKDYFETHQAGTFALESHVRYLKEVRVGQQVTVRTRVVGRSEKRFHFLHLMTNDETQVLAAVSEVVGTHVDLRTRRSSPFSPEVAAAFDHLLAEHSQLPWPAPLCGAMRV
jgi:acyl-CoA thioester hydrolase